MHSSQRSDTSNARTRWTIFLTFLSVCTLLGYLLNNYCRSSDSHSVKTEMVEFDENNLSAAENTYGGYTTVVNIRYNSATVSSSNNGNEVDSNSADNDNDDFAYPTSASDHSNISDVHIYNDTDKVYAGKDEYDSADAGDSAPNNDLSTSDPENDDCICLDHETFDEVQSDTIDKDTDNVNDYNYNAYPATASESSYVTPAAPAVVETSSLDLTPSSSSSTSSPLSLSGTSNTSTKHGDCINGQIPTTCHKMYESTLASFSNTTSTAAKCCAYNMRMHCTHVVCGYFITLGDPCTSSYIYAAESPICWAPKSQVFLGILFTIMFVGFIAGCRCCYLLDRYFRRYDDYLYVPSNP